MLRWHVSLPSPLRALACGSTRYGATEPPPVCHGLCSFCDVLTVLARLVAAGGQQGKRKRSAHTCTRTRRGPAWPGEKEAHSSSSSSRDLLLVWGAGLRGRFPGSCGETQPLSSRVAFQVKARAKEKVVEYKQRATEHLGAYKQRATDLRRRVITGDKTKRVRDYVMVCSASR